MEVLPPFWMWEGEISSPLLKVLQDEADQRHKIDGALFGSRQDVEVRKSRIVPLGPAYWFSGVLHNYALLANSQANWRRTVLFPENCQVAYYSPGEFYDWHMDSHLLNNEPTVRKLTTICFLSDPSEYEGGELQIKHTPFSAKPKKGTVLVFPSVLDHRVTPVTSGLRVTATTWSHGPNTW